MVTSDQTMGRQGRVGECREVPAENSSLRPNTTSNRTTPIKSPVNKNTNSSHRAHPRLHFSPGNLIHFSKTLLTIFICKQENDFHLTKHHNTPIYNKKFI